MSAALRIELASRFPVVCLECFVTQQPVRMPEPVRREVVSDIPAESERKC